MLLLLCSATLLEAEWAGGARSASPRSRFAALPLSFEAEEERAEPAEVQYVAHGGGYGIALTQEGAVLSVSAAEEHRGFAMNAKIARPRSATLRLELPGGRAEAAMRAEEPLPGRVNYFIGNDPAKWQRDLPTWGRVRYAGVYPGVDLVYYGTQGGQLEYDFELAAHADPSAIRIRFAGARTLRLDVRGDLHIGVEGGEIVFERPVVYQPAGGRRRRVSGDFRVGHGQTVSFKLGDYDRSHPLVIDPKLVYATFLGGAKGGGSLIQALAVDGQGSAYVAGYTNDPTFPSTPGAYQTAYPASSEYPGHVRSCGFVSKLNAAGTALVYSTYLGGANVDQPTALADTYLYGIAVDSGGNAFVTGATFSPNFPTTPGAFMTTANIGDNQLAGNTIFTASAGIVVSLNANGDGLNYSTFLTGSNKLVTSGPAMNFYEGSSGGGIALDSAGNAYIAGGTSCSDFPVTGGAFQSTNQGPEGYETGFVASLNGNGTELNYATYLGGAAALSDKTGTNGVPYPPGGLGFFVDAAFAIAVDKMGNAYVGGGTVSTTFPTTTGAFQTANLETGGFNSTLSLVGAGGVTGFVASMKPDGTGLNYSTYLGGSDTAEYGDMVNAIALDGAGDVYAGGFTDATDFPTTIGAFQAADPNTTGHSGAFVAKLNQNGSALVYSTYLGGPGTINGYGTNRGVSWGTEAIAVDGKGYAYATGIIPSIEFPVTANALEPLPKNDHPAFVAILDPTGSKLTYGTYLGGSGYDMPQGIFVDGVGRVFVAGWTSSRDFPATPGAFQAIFPNTQNGSGAGYIAEFPALTLAGSSIALTVSAAQIAKGEELQLTAKVTPVTATGVVKLYDGATLLGQGNLSGGVAHFSLSSMAIGKHGLQAVYGGDANNAGSESEVVTVTVIAATPLLGLSVKSLEFASTSVGALSAAKTILLSNHGTGVALIKSIAVTGSGAAAFHETNTCVRSLPAGGHCAIRVAFKPSGAGLSRANVSITDNAAGSPQNVTISGTGIGKTDIPEFSLKPGTYAKSQKVRVTDATPEATIYYTTNGTTPSRHSTKYIGAILVSSSETIRAIATATDRAPSPVAEAKYMIQQSH